ncbi:hypothetical protein GCM10012280_36490 [Wenjunlia tyrosinilytica]|uniref:Uncharacterized protein n=1 Tax=Wenjunlia tyrosinilytica TaxID=1544741 RepID=A0A917ZT32_9ACTN|nr:hypothetical protein GCM10012280_36490 [Wenjunlia tyrosinilytica]
MPDPDGADLQGIERRMYFLTPSPTAGHGQMKSPGPRLAALPGSRPERLSDPRVLREALEATAGAIVNGAEWLASCASVPADVFAAWNGGRLAHVPAGVNWQIVRAIKPLGLDAVVRMCASKHHLGPVLLTMRDGVVEFLVAPGTVDGWDLPGTTVDSLSRTLYCPHPHVVPLRAVEGRTWLVPPDGTGGLTDGDLLYEALAAARAAAAVVGATW